MKWSSALDLICLFVFVLLSAIWYREHALKDSAVSALKNANFKLPETPGLTRLATKLIITFTASREELEEESSSKRGIIIRAHKSAYMISAIIEAIQHDSTCAGNADGHEPLNINVKSGLEYAAMKISNDIMADIEACDSGIADITVNPECMWRELTKSG